MTIEFSLRRRALQSRYLAILWLSLAIAILLATYVSLPYIAGKTLTSIATTESVTAGSKSPTDQSVIDEKRSHHAQIYTVGTLALGLFAVSFACFLLGRTAFVEIELAA